MGKYIVKRILLAVLTVFIICAITFFLMHAVPGGPFNREKALSEATIAALNSRYNLDKPVAEQFLLYMKNLLHGDFGVSLKNGREIKAVIGESFPISARLGISAMIVALFLGTVFGSTAALMRNKLPDRLIVFFLATLLLSLAAPRPIRGRGACGLLQLRGERREGGKPPEGGDRLCAAKGFKTRPGSRSGLCHLPHKLLDDD